MPASVLVLFFLLFLLLLLLLCFPMIKDLEKVNIGQYLNKEQVRARKLPLRT